MDNTIKDSLKASEMIARYLCDPSNEMTEELKAWIEESDSNYIVFEKALNGAQIAKSLDHIDSVDTARGWKALGVTCRNRRIRNMLIASLSAASVLLAALFLFAPEVEYSQFELSGTYISIVDSNGNEYMLPGKNQHMNIGVGSSSIIKEGDRITVKGADVAGGEKHKPELITVKISRGGEYQLVLPDGSDVWLGAETTLTFPERFGDGQREVEITGEGNFTVVHDAQRPFIVCCDEVSITVLGTIFHIYGFREENTITTTLIEGSIRQSFHGAAQCITLRPSQQTVYSRYDGDISVREVDTNDIQAYRADKRVFRNVPLRDIAASLERTFDCEITIENDAIADECYHLIINKKRGVDFVLEQLTKSGGISYEKVNGKNKYLLLPEN